MILCASQSSCINMRQVRMSHKLTVPGCVNPAASVSPSGEMASEVTSAQPRARAFCDHFGDSECGRAGDDGLAPQHLSQFGTRVIQVSDFWTSSRLAKQGACGRCFVRCSIPLGQRRVCSTS